MEIQRAFNVWSGFTDLTFTPKSGQVHIEIRFESGEHGDGDPFDGPGGTLAHAYFPVSTATTEMQFLVFFFGFKLYQITLNIILIENVPS